MSGCVAGFGADWYRLMASFGGVVWYHLTNVNRRLKMIRLLILLTAASCLLAQSPQATVNGTVTDTQGALVVGAIVDAVNIDTGVTTSATTNESGIYSLRFLPVGSYTIK